MESIPVPDAMGTYAPEFLAKSAEYGGETLARHTWDVVEKVAAHSRLRPTLSIAIPGTSNLWHCLFWSCLFHDLGKAARGFQARLRGGERWPHRHEVLSLAFFDWIAHDLSEEEQRCILAAIVSHHRDASIIQTMYPGLHPDPLIGLLEELDEETISALWHWVHECAELWRQLLGFSATQVRLVSLLPHDEAVVGIRQQGVQRVRYWLRKYDRWVDTLQHKPYSPQQLVPYILLRGFTTTSDHMASAHLGALSDPLQEPWQQLAKRVLKPAQRWYQHQEASALLTRRSALLISPTGSGKTESGLYWALGDGNLPVVRLFYVLPYQASMNAMFLRLQDPQKGFPAEKIGLQHGRAVQALYARLVDQEVERRTAKKLASWEKNMNMLHARPVKVLSPYQLLKAVFRLRGFEALLTDCVQAAFIFDEIHAYEPGRLALLLALMQYLREHYAARFFVMSATFPTFLQAKLTQALDLSPEAIVTADHSIYQRFQRHRLILLEGGLLEEGISHIVTDVQAGKAVLACANSVRRAQHIYHALQKAGLTKDQLVLIHSRYILKHRIQREQEIFARCGVDRPSQPMVVIATQVVEVSLNIDLDTIYSDPAPLEALLQRFGRVNRACKKGICPVHVFKHPNNGQYIYDDTQVQTTLKELALHDRQEIDESQITSWLDHIYQGKILSQWEKDYQRIAQSTQVLLANLRPFESDPQSEQAFEEMFDNVEVVPECFAAAYLECLKQDDFLEASQYMVGISKKKYQQLERKGLVSSLQETDTKSRKRVVRLPYSEESGLSFETHPLVHSHLDPLEGTEQGGENQDWD